MTIEKVVFGISPGPRGRFAFVSVAATVHDRRLVAVANARDEFPTEGDVYVEDTFWIPPDGVGAIWRVRSGTYSIDRKHAEYSAYARGREGPLEIISIPVSSGAPNSVRKCLCEGLELGYVPAERVLLRLEDGVVVGPVRTKALVDGRSRGIICTEESFVDPLDRWEDVLPLEPFLVEDNNALARRRRSFASYLDLPERQAYFDAAAFGDSVKSVLKAVQTDPAITISKRQLAELVRVIGDGTAPDRLRSRASRILNAVRSAALSREEIESIVPAALGNPQVVQELALLKEQVAQQERSRLSDALKADTDRLKSLNAQIQLQEQRSKELEEELLASEAKVEASIHTAAERLSEKLRDVLSEPEKLLADVAILRPLLSHRDVRPDDLHPIATGAANTRSGATRQLPLLGHLGSSPSNSDEVLGVLECGLRAIGLMTRPARVLSRELVASLAVGEIPVLKGSLAGVVARASAQALCGKNVYLLSIPFGAFDSELVRSALDDVLKRTTAEVQVCALVIEGMDRSPIEAYGEELAQLVGVRVMGIEAGGQEIMVFGTLCGGLGGLPLAGTLCDLGPLIDVDNFAYNRKSKPNAATHPGITCDVWQKTRSALLIDAESDWPDVPSQLSALDILGSPLWRRGFERVGQALSVANNDDQLATREALLCDWLIPRAIGDGVDIRQIAERSRNMGVELEIITSSNNDGRLARLISRLERSFGTGSIGSPV